MVTKFNAKAAPVALGPYSHAAIHGGVIYLSGQLGIDPATAKMVPGEIEDECRQVLTNIQNILEEAGTDLSQVIQTRLYIVDLDDFARINSVYKEFFGEFKPARSSLEVSSLPLGAMVEIEVIAAIESNP